MKHSLSLLIGIFTIPLLAQIDRSQTSDSSPYSVIQQDTLRRRPLQSDSKDDSIVYVKRVISDYQFWRNNQKREIVDTTLTIDSYYKQNFVEKDLFGKMPFPNIGRPFTALEVANKPFGAALLPAGKRENYLYAEDIRYFDVKTPMTQFVYENGVREGNYLSSLFTHNLNSQFNYAVQYRGLRSQGLYRRELAANNALVISSNYHTKDKRLSVWGHFSRQNIDNQENNGLQDIHDFIDGKERNLTNVRNIEVNMNETQSKYDSRRYFLGASYGILPKYTADSTFYHAVKLSNQLTFEDQIYKLNSSQTDLAPWITEENNLVGLMFLNEKKLKSFTNVTTAEFKWSDRLTIDAGLKYQNLRLFGREDYPYYPTSIPNIPYKWSQNLIGLVGQLQFDWSDRLSLNGHLEFLQSEDYGSLYNIDAALKIAPIEGYSITAGVLAQSDLPAINAMYNQSPIEQFNYFYNDFNTVKTRKLYGVLSLEKFKTQIEAAYFTLDDWIYFGSDLLPAQLDDAIQTFKIKGRNHLSYNGFNLVSTLQYQKTTKNEEYMPLPDFLVRETLYWQGKVFNRKAEIQTGVNAYYFSSFDAQGFSPIFNEFYLQDPTQLQSFGNYPMIDLFINAKIRNMRLFIRGDHFNAIFGKRDYFSSPGTPYRGFKFQIGIKWDLFT